MSASEGYAAIPSWMLRDSEISGIAILVYASLASRSGFESIHPGQAIIASEARCSERRVRDALKELEALGVVERIERRFAGGQRASDGYVLHSGRRPNALATLPWDNDELPAGGSGSKNQPADNDRANRQNPTIAPSIEITTKEIDKGSEKIRADVERLLDLLDEEISKNGVRKLPKRNQTNANAIRLLLDRDGFSEDEVAAIIRWAQADQFWHTNILSASKLREKIETLRAQMDRNQGRSGASSPASRALAVDLGGNSITVVNSPQIAVEQQRALGPSILGEMNRGTW